MTRKLLGRDGLTSDEVVAEYYRDGNDIVRSIWDEETRIVPADALAELRVALHNSELAYKVAGDRYDLKRTYAIREAITTISTEFGLEIVF